MRVSIGHKWADLASFGHVQPIFFNDLGGKHLAPKAEVTGSNPVGCANDFKWSKVILLLLKNVSFGVFPGNSFTYSSG